MDHPGDPLSDHDARMQAKGQIIGLHRIGRLPSNIMNRLGFSRDLVLETTTEFDARLRRNGINPQDGDRDHGGMEAFGGGGGDQVDDEMRGFPNHRAEERGLSMPPAFRNDPPEMAPPNQEVPALFPMEQLGPANIEKENREVQAVIPMKRAASAGIDETANAIKVQNEEDDEEVVLVSAGKAPEGNGAPPDVKGNVQPIRGQGADEDQELVFVSARKAPERIPNSPDVIITGSFKSSNTRSANVAADRETATPGTFKEQLRKVPTTHMLCASKTGNTTGESGT